MSVTPFGSVIPQILDCRVFAVVGASRDPAKYGHMVYMALKAAGYTVYPINPNAEDIDGDPAYPLLDNLPETPECVVVVAPPAVTEQSVKEAGRLGTRYIWMQPGAESQAAANAARGAGLVAVYGGPCIMVAVKTARNRKRTR